MTYGNLSVSKTSFKISNELNLYIYEKDKYFEAELGEI